MTIGTMYHTGERSPSHARYAWEKYIDGTRDPQPTIEEIIISLDVNDVFPPVRSCNKGAVWKMVSCY